MTQAKAEKLRQFIDDFFEGRQKRLAEEYGLSPSLVSTWLSEKSEKSEVPAYMDRIIDLRREVRALSTTLEAMRTGCLLAMKSGYAIVHFPNEAEPGAILCRGISDLETATRVVTAIRVAESPKTPEEPRNEKA